MHTPQASAAKAIAPSPPASPRSLPRRLLRLFLLSGVLPYAVITLGVVLGQRQLIFPGQSATRVTRPKGAESALGDIVVVSRDNLSLHGWVLTATQASAGPQSTSEPPSTSAAVDGAPAARAEVPVRLVLYFPGNGGDRGSRLHDLQEVARRGFDVLIVDYRGYGGNPGRPSEQSLHQDARSVWDAAVAQLGYRPQEIIVYGESLGGAVATRLVSTLCQSQTPPRGLIVSSTFDSMSAVVARKFPLFPFRWLLWDTFRSVEAIRQVTCPVTILHGRNDTLVPLEHGQNLFAAAPAQSDTGIAKRFVEVPNMGHNGLPARVLAEALLRNAGRPPEE